MSKETLLYTIRVSMIESDGEPAIRTEVKGTDKITGLLENFEDFAEVNGIFHEDLHESVSNLLLNLHIMQEKVDKQGEVS